MAGRGVSRFQQKMKMSTLEMKVLCKLNPAFVTPVDQVKKLPTARAIHAWAKSFRRVSAAEQRVLDEDVDGLIADIALDTDEEDGEDEENGGDDSAAAAEEIGGAGTEDENEAPIEGDVMSDSDSSLKASVLHGLAMQGVPEDFDDPIQIAEKGIRQLQQMAEDFNRQGPAVGKEFVRESYEAFLLGKSQSSSSASQGVAAIRRPRRATKSRQDSNYVWG